MKFVQLVRLLLFISISVFIFSCKKNEDKTIEIQPDSLKKEYNLLSSPIEFSKEVLSELVFFAFYDSIYRIIGAIEEDSLYGIRFYAIAPFDSINKVKFQSELLDGSSDLSRYNVQNLPGDTLKYIYFNTGSEYIGARNFEVYQYLFNPTKKLLFKNYMYIDMDDGTIHIYFSSNVRKKNYIKEYFIKMLREYFIEDLNSRTIVRYYDK